MKRWLFPALMAFVLSSCIDIDAHMKFSEDGTVDVAMVTTISNDMHELMNMDGGENFCTGIDEKRTKQKDTVSCTVVSKTDISTMIAESYSFDVPTDSDDTSMPMRVTEIREGVLDITVDFREMMEGDEETNTPEMKAILTAATANNFMKFGFTAKQIISSTGDVSADGRTATINIPMPQIISQTAPEEFNTVLRYKEAGFFAGILEWLYSIWPF